MNKQIEANLIERIIKGDEDAFSDFYRIYRDRVYGFAYRMTIDRAVAEDITHEVFISVIEEPGRFESERGSLLTFLCAIARNKMMNYLRLKHNSDVGFDDFENFDAPEDSSQYNSPLKILLNRELAEQVHICIASLPPLQREAIILRQFQELSYEEIARVTETDLSAVKSRLHRARQNLAIQLAGYVKLQKEKDYELC